MPLVVTATGEYTCDNCGVVTATTTMSGAFNPPLPEGWAIVNIVKEGSSVVEYLGPECIPLFKITNP